MSTKIFISYRRADSADITVALYNELREHFEDERIFKDINNIPPGMDFSQVLAKALDEAAVVLAIIGPEFISGSGTRLFDEADWVRQELALSLQRNLRVVPVLVNGAKLPEPTELPPDLQPLRKRQIARIDNGRFQYDVQQLSVGISDLIPLKKKQAQDAPDKNGPWDNVFKGVLLILMLSSIGLISFAWIFSEEETLEKLIMSVLGGGGLLGGWAAFTRQRWIELRSNQIISRT